MEWGRKSPWAALWVYYTLAIETHLERIAQHRPLAQIADPQQRAEAEGGRAWFREEFLNALQ